MASFPSAASSADGLTPGQLQRATYQQKTRRKTVLKGAHKGERKSGMLVLAVGTLWRCIIVR